MTHDASSPASQKQAKLHRIVIAGGGTAGWMAAAAFVRFLPEGYAISLIESDDIGTVGVGEATIPQINLFNSGLGLDEAEFVRETQGSYKLGIEFAGWGQKTENGFGQRYIHAFGQVGRGLGLIGFHHYWRKAQAAGFAKPLHHYILNHVAADAGKFAHSNRAQDGAVPPITYAFHFDAGLYARYLRRYAEARGVVRHEGMIQNIQRDATSGDISVITLNNGTTITGDIFIDCTGFRGLLIGETLGIGYDDWRHWLPCDRAVAVPCASVDGITPYTRSTARKAGWQWRIPLQHRTGNGHVFCSDYISEDEATAILMDNLDGEALADPRPLRFTTGKRQSFWHKNVIAMGLASGFMEPLESTSIHLIQSAIARLLGALPRDVISDAERDAYNRETTREFEAIRDFLILHYHANGRVGEPFWDACRTMEIPQTLSDKIAVFRAQGRVERAADDLFTEPGWVQVMLGQGIVPERWSPLADAISDADLREFLAMLESAYAREVDRLPLHKDYLNQFCLPPKPTSAAA